MSLRDIGLALLVVLVWGLNFVAIRWGVDEVPPLLLTALRYTAAAIPAIFLVRRPNIGIGLVIAYGLAIGVFQFGLLYAAISLGMPAGLSSLVMQIQAFFTVIFAIVLLGERPGALPLAGGTVALLGIGLIGLERLEGPALVPLLMTVLAALFWGVGNIITKKAGKIDMLSFVVWSSLVPPIPLLLASAVLEGPASWGEAFAALTWKGGGSLLFMAYGATLLGYGLWSVLLSRYPANLVAPFSLLVPVAGIASAALLLGETISGLEIAGSLIVFIGLMLTVFGARVVSRVRTRVKAV